MVSFLADVHLWFQSSCAQDAILENIRHPGCAEIGTDRRRHKIRLEAYSINLTNHGNFNDVDNNVTSPLFGQFVGFQRRTDGLIISFVD